MTYKRLSGKHAEFYAGGVKIIDAYDCNIRVEQEVYESSAYGEDWKGFTRGRASHSGSAKRYATYGNIGTFLAMVGNQAGGTDYASDAYRPLRIVLYQEAGSTNRIFEGDVWLTEADITVPSGGLIDSTLSWTGDGAPVAIA